MLKQRRDFPERLDELVVLSKRRWEQIVRFIHDEKIPRQLGAWSAGCRVRDSAGRQKLLQDVRLPQVVVGGDNARERSPRVGVQAKSPLNGMGFRAVDKIEVEGKFRLHLALPLLCERRGRENQDPTNAPANQQLP